tara:strand:+ start:1312 stop:1812 length:501 start_codon:yes stop_codon:yes gene_type:complete
MYFVNNNIIEQDLQSALKIYNFYISNSFSNFEEKELSIRQFRLLYKKITMSNLPFIIAKENKRVLGIAYVNNFRDKSGYRFTFEHSIYVDQNFTKRGYGSKILKKLIIQCKKNKHIKNLIAVIGSSDNIASIKIHKKNGFKYIGTILKAGYKKNKWVDSVYMQKRI